MLGPGRFCISGFRRLLKSGDRCCQIEAGIDQGNPRVATAAQRLRVKSATMGSMLADTPASLLSTMARAGMSGQDASAFAGGKMLSQHARRLVRGKQCPWWQSPRDITDGRIVWRFRCARSSSLLAGASPDCFGGVGASASGDPPPSLWRTKARLVQRAHGVVVAHAPRMRKALGSIPSVSSAST